MTLFLTVGLAGMALTLRAGYKQANSGAKNASLPLDGFHRVGAVSVSDALGQISRQSLHEKFDFSDSVMEIAIHLVKALGVYSGTLAAVEIKPSVGDVEEWA